MTRTSLPVRCLFLALLSGAALAAADEGMFLFNRPPKEALKKAYGFEPTPEWMEHVQKSCVRFSTGGSGSIVSENGLVMTNHHVGRDIVEKLSTPEKNMLETGFLAQSPAEELKAPDLELLSLWGIEDVSERVLAAGAGKSAAEADAARRSAMAQIEEETRKSTGLHCETVTLYQGARYHLYKYKRYTDVRLVFVPESSIAAFGGDVDNFEYPRYDLDMTFFRIWEDGKPLKAEHHLAWSPNGCKEGELVLVAGHPGRTERLNTLAHLDYLRDVRHPNTLQRLWRSEVKLTNFAQRSPENSLASTSDLLSVQNSRKAYTGMLAGLLDPQLMGAKRDAEKALRAAVEKNPEWKASWGDAWGKLEAAEKVAAELYPRYVALGSTGMTIGSNLFGQAATIVRLTAEKEKQSGERLREFRESNLETVLMGLYSPAPIYPAYEIERLEAGLSYMAETLGGDDPLVLKVLDGKSPGARAAELVTGSKLADVAARKTLVEGGKTAVEGSKDPLIALARLIDPTARELRKRWEDEVSSVEREAYAQIAAAKFALEGENVYPDATFTLRLSYGPVRGYKEAGKDVPAFTTTSGLYERWEQRKKAEPFNLPERWVAARGKLDPKTPFNFVCTADIIGGNSGSPTINTRGEVVGLIFDGNIQSLPANFAYTDEVARAVSVDSRIILEALRKVYGADALAAELTGQTN
jgi:Peptidase S46